ncbi:MAG: hypothetical protein PUB67_01880 [Clostridiales bacterium]|nr:hypothetical protein [Clostridiales bacterium]
MIGEMRYVRVVLNGLLRAIRKLRQVCATETTLREKQQHIKMYAREGVSAKQGGTAGIEFNDLSRQKFFWLRQVFLYFGRKTNDSYTFWIV